MSKLSALRGKKRERKVKREWYMGKGEISKAYTDFMAVITDLQKPTQEAS